MKKKSVCLKCGHKRFTLVSQKDRDILICKRCGDITVYPKEPRNKAKNVALVSILCLLLKIGLFIAHFTVLGAGVLAIMDLFDLVNVF